MSTTVETPLVLKKGDFVFWEDCTPQCFFLAKNAVKRVVDEKHVELFFLCRPIRMSKLKLRTPDDLDRQFFQHYLNQVSD